MYTFLINEDNTLTSSVVERVMQRSKLVDVAVPDAYTKAEIDKKIKAINDAATAHGRYRVTNLESRIGKYPISVNVSGYVDPSYIELV